MPDDKKIDLNRDFILTPQGRAALGVICAHNLIKYGQVHLKINDNGIVELEPLYLDKLPEEDAILHLVKEGWTNEQIVQYLIGREERNA